MEIMFGSFATVIPAGVWSMPKEIGRVSQPFATVAIPQSSTFEGTMSQQIQTETTLDAFSESYQRKREQNPRVVCKAPRGLYKYRYLKGAEKIKYLQRQHAQTQALQKLELENRLFFTTEHEITEISSHILNVSKRIKSIEEPAQTPILVRKKLRKIVKKPRVPTIELDNLIGAITNIGKGKSNFSIEVVDRAKTLVDTLRTHNNMYARVHVNHLSGRRTQRDLVMNSWTTQLVGHFARRLSWNKRHDNTNIRRGMSGCVLRRELMTGNFGASVGEMFIVRGSLKGRIYDARMMLSKEIVMSMVHYSSVGDTFWRGFNKAFLETRTMPEHQCKSDLPVEDCGAVAAIVCQIVYPCGKITCQQCIREYCAKTDHEIMELVKQGMDDGKGKRLREYVHFPHAERIIDLVVDRTGAQNQNYEAFADITHMMSDRKEAPVSHINKINEILIKGGSATADDFITAHEHLREIARYHKNRTENIRKGSLATFRNKVSSKTMVNPVLFCDNQRDRNGNFLWGERGYHAKRFFTNYFDLVNPDDGYDKYIRREFPNGSRKLAIGNLIVSTNFETLRRHMIGERIETVELGQHCVSKLNGNFVYPCCCVTGDDGVPLLTDIRAPTKHHLVVGNTGDAKYIDLPESPTQQMYIAQNGFCYINIFLAMLVNVDENRAKDFTKIVRDKLMPQLGKWPTVIDVATACYMLTIFCPGTQSAELPKIYVDHTTKTMHVIDSYGSITTGYHILKANTVSQFIQFASNALESDMKHYVMGGEEPETSYAKTHKLIRAIYRPKEMEEILMSEPYTLLCSLVSPTVLLSMYNSGSFEKALHRLADKDMNLSALVNLYSSLARKVSGAHCVISQYHILESNAQNARDLIEIQDGANDGRHIALMLLETMSIQASADLELTNQGYATFRNESKRSLEKIYVRALQDSWSELGWLERFSSIRDCRKWQPHITEQLHLQELPDLTTTDAICWSSPYGYLKKQGGRACSWAAQKAIRTYDNFRIGSTKFLFKTAKFFAPDLMNCITFSLVLTTLLSIVGSAQSILNTYRRLKYMAAEAAAEKAQKKINTIYKEFRKGRDTLPTVDEFIEHVEKVNPELVEPLMQSLYGDNHVRLQAKKKCEVELERIIAFLALIMMVFDNEKSDYVHRSLSKVKSLMTSIDQDVQHQSVDDVLDDFSERKLHIDFEIESDVSQHNLASDTTFKQWWGNQLERNNVVPHYRTGGHFMEFTRKTASHVANEIAHGQYKEILLRGAVGSGKSTGLPFHLHTKGPVLLLEPTRPLAENVCKQLQGDPFHISPTLRMRGMSVFGSTPVTVMTSGFALHHCANNPLMLRDFSFIIIDECHVQDSNAMAFLGLLHAHSYEGKIVKVSATPPGREVEFQTEHKVDIKTEDMLSFQQFVTSLGSGSNTDAIKYGNNILVYVASYNEVDKLSKLLIDQKFDVTKVDGRTMKLGKVSIVTHGTDQRKHFIVATNIIENGVTLDVDVVVDFGTKVVPTFDLDNRCMRYTVTSISYGERIQRLGRVGRFKKGTAIRIGWTEKGITEIQPTVATEAAFLSFVYGLPVMTQNVTTSILANCTVRQARTMLQFELSPFYMADLVRFDGSMHPAIHAVLKKYKLRDSEIILNKLAIPSSKVSTWLSARDYSMTGFAMELDPNVRLPFRIRDIPDTIHEKIWDCVLTHKADSGFGRIASASACKVAYTLQTDIVAVQRTLRILDALIVQETEKQAFFKAITASSSVSGGFSLNAIVQKVRARYAKDFTTENLGILHAAKAQIQEFDNLREDASFCEMNHHFLISEVEKHGAMKCVMHQNMDSVSEALELKGRWNKSLITQDIILLGSLLVGGVWMTYSYFTNSANEQVHHQGSNKRQRQKLKFRKARDQKLGTEVYGDDGVMTQYFGDAYESKAKLKGKHTKGMGSTKRRFVNVYGFDPTEYNFVRFVDPLTGYTLDENPITDIKLVQDHFTEARLAAIRNDELDLQRLNSSPGIEAYYIKNLTTAALKIDMTPHNPRLLCTNSNSIAKFHDREFELRQTGAATTVDAKNIPGVNEAPEEVTHEAKALFRGVRDYNPIASMICKLENKSDGVTTKIFGIGFGGMIITNQHLFHRNNGELRITSRHGEYLIRNTTTLNLLPCKGHDILIIRLPKDFPPFPQRLRFRLPEANEKICLVGSNFQDKSVSSMVSECSITVPEGGGNFWKHWIETKDGYCGLPLVSTKDGFVVGLHSLASNFSTVNYYACLPRNFEDEVLKTSENVEWTRGWKYNANEVCWGGLKLTTGTPTGLFKTSKLVTDLDTRSVRAQSSLDEWVYNELKGNLKAVARCPGNLVTKHTYKGKCQLFNLYLSTHPDEQEYFSGKLGAYQKSRLNKAAYLLDIMKYSTSIEVGLVDTDLFEETINAVEDKLRKIGLENCEYVTDHQAIFDSMNMKSAVGALYGGKKRDYFKDFTEVEKDLILKQSCERLYTAKFGLWNGSLKAELRPKEKVELNKTRTFTAAPIDTLLGGKACVDDFNNQFYNFHIKGPWSVGMTKFFRGWDTMLRKLPDGWIYCDADGSQFDSSLSPYLINSILELRLRFMEDWDIGAQMLCNLYTEIIYTPIATPDGTVIKKFKGNNSGQPSTVVDNTLMVILVMMYSLAKEGIPHINQDEVCCYFVNGDDLLIAIRPDHEYLLDSLREDFLSFGLKYDFSNRTRNKGDVWYMSQQGVLIDDVYIPKLEEERIVSILEWDRATEPQHRLEAICAAMVEAWGYPELLHEIRKFYAWVLDQAPYNEIARAGGAPYISETALRRLYTLEDPTTDELIRYLEAFYEVADEMDDCEVFHQSGESIDAGRDPKARGTPSVSAITPSGIQPKEKDKDVNVGTTGLFTVPRLKMLTAKLRAPHSTGKAIMNLDHLLTYEPDQTSLYNTRATQKQFDAWYTSVMGAYGVDESGMALILNGLMVWCIENGTSPNINGMWVMMDGEEQVEYPIRPLLEFAQPTFRQIMAHFSNIAEAYIEMRNSKHPYMPRYGLQRNLRDHSLARYAFDFYEITSRTPDRAREAHLQMKAAALRNSENRLFGLDGNISTKGEDTERHTVEDVNAGMHSMLGVRM